MGMGDTEARIAGVIQRRVKPGLDLSALDSDTAIIGSGLGLDSVAVLELVAGLEEEFEIEIDESELKRETFDSFRSLAAHLEANYLG